METVNVGVVLFCPEENYIDVQMNPDNERVRRLFGEEEIYDGDENLKFMIDAMQSRIRIEADRFRTLADLEHFVHTRANNIILTSPRWVRVEDPSTELQALFNELVLSPRSQHGASYEPHGESAHNGVQQTVPDAGA
jgi:hypothetical protein